jgi:hypothetical protein
MQGTGTSFSEKGIEIESASAAGTKSFIKVTDGDSSATSPYVSVSGTGITFHPAAPTISTIHSRIWGRETGENGWNILTATLGNNIADSSLNALASYSAATNTVTFSSANYSTFNSVRLIPQSARDTVRISFGAGNQLGSSRMYLIPFALVVLVTTLAFSNEQRWVLLCLHG